MPVDPPADTTPGLAPATVAVTAGRPAAVPDAPLNPAITMASTYIAGGDLEYGRYTNPTWVAFEEALGELEGGRCLTFASGLAAAATVLDLIAQGEKVVGPQHAYLGVVMQMADLEARGRAQAVFVDLTDTDAVIAAAEDAAIVWLESPANPTLELADLPAIIERTMAHRVDAIAVSNTTLSRTGVRDSAVAKQAGGLSGPPLFARSTAVLGRVYRLTGGRVPLIGIGGIGSGETALAKLEAGASLLQLYTALVYHGPALVGQICAELSRCLDRDGLTSISQVVGRAADHWAEMPFETTS